MSIPRITLVVGSETLLVDRAVLGVSAAARSADPSVQRSVIAASDENGAHELREATAPNLFGDGGVVVVTGIDAADDSLDRALREVVADVPDNVFLVLTHPGGMKGKSLLDAVKAAGAEVVDCAPVKRGKPTIEFLGKEFARHRRKVTGPAVVALYESIGQDLGLLAGAVSQLVSDVDAVPIDIDDVRDYFAGVADVSGFTIADAVWDRKYVEAMRLLRQAMMSSDPGRVGPMTVSSLASGLRSLVRVGGMPPGTAQGVIAKEAGVPPWKVEALRRQWARWSGDQRRLAAAVVSLADADGAVKGGVLEGSSLDTEQKLLTLEILVSRTAGH
ncbi:MAG: DNA polymerase III subunit delta [Actinobacteria bacterium]|jgi:DNA polymerase-3 subunit delta|nr:DNA polymerase III subunit delta [Actinomycetota bacterium]